MMQVDYTVIIEKGTENYGAYVPDLPGCVAAADTVEEALQLITEAIQFHIEGLIEDGEPIPPSTSVGHKVQVQIAA